MPGSRSPSSSARATTASSYAPARPTNGDVAHLGTALDKAAGGATKQRDELIGPSLGSELRTKALVAFGVALLAQMLYVAARFRWTFGVAALSAMFHDVILVVGVFAWLDEPIDGVFLASVLTIIGLSVNDTVVTLDRIREQWSTTRERDFSKVANEAVLDVMPRTVNTGLGAMFILAALLVLGCDSLHDFALALLLGLLIGTYSSAFTATPVAVMLHRRWPMDKAEPVKKSRTSIRRDPRNSGSVI